MLVSTPCETKDNNYSNRSFADELEQLHGWQRLQRPTVSTWVNTLKSPVSTCRPTLLVPLSRRTFFGNNNEVVGPCKPGKLLEDSVALSAS